MGSLMAGWSSPFQDPKTVIYQRNKSLTREEIDAYWRSQKNDEEHRDDTKGFVNNSNQENIHQKSGEKPQRSTSLPLMDRRESIMNSVSALDGIKTSCWWTRSHSAFLNEPPVIAMEGPSYKYASQYQVTKFDSPT